MELPVALPAVRYAVPDPVFYQTGGTDLSAPIARQPLVATYTRSRPLPDGAWLYLYDGMG